MSFDIIGSKEKAVAIVEIAEGEDEKKIAEEIMKKHKNVKSVLKKISGREGEFRLRKYKLVAGDENTEVIHKEYGYSLKLDPQKVYFSPRESEERQRIAKQVRPGEKILVLGSGVAPLPIAIVKKQPKVEKIFGIEMNEDAHKYAEENIRINKVSHKIVLIKGDCREVLKNLNQNFDRIIIPTPFNIPIFLRVVMPYISKGILHFYFIGKEEDPFSEAIEMIKKIAQEFNKKVEILSKEIALPYGTRKWKVRIDCYLH